MKHLTIRNVPRRLADALDREKRRRGASLNRTVLDVLGEAMGTSAATGHRTGLARLAGTWTADEQAEFDAAVAPTEQIDPELWR